jgi:homoserine O-acetyltransferase/O-succinyltransferase
VVRVWTAPGARGLRPDPASGTGAVTCHGGDLAAALQAIEARTIIAPVDDDRYFPPVDSRDEARHIPGAEVRVVASAWGHVALTNPADAAAIDAPLRELLAG